jgi:hypothetical protein
LWISVSAIVLWLETVIGPGFASPGMKYYYYYY